MSDNSKAKPVRRTSRSLPLTRPHTTKAATDNENPAGFVRKCKEPQPQKREKRNLSLPNCLSQKDKLPIQDNQSKSANPSPRKAKDAGKGDVLDSDKDSSLDVDTNNNNNKVTASGQDANDQESKPPEIPEVLRKQGAASLCSSNIESNCPCNTLEAVEQVSRQISYCDRKNWISVERLNELRKKAQDSIKNHKTFTIRGCFFSIRNALASRGWVEKLDIHRKHTPSGICQVTFDDLTQTLPKRRPGESRRQYLIKCERNIMSRFLEHMPIDFLWTARKEKCDWIDQAKNPTMIINKFHRVPFTTKEGLCTQLRDFHWFYEEGTSELYFPRCYNVWSPEELSDFVEDFRTTSVISFLKWILDKFSEVGYEAIFSENAKVPLSAIDFALKRCNDFLDSSQHIDIDMDEPIRIWEHDWDAFFTNHDLLTNENARIQVDSKRPVDGIIRCARRVLDQVKIFWPQFGLDGYRNIWIVKPANKCRGRGIHLMNNIKKIVHMVNPPIATKSRYVVQKYVERPLIIHNTKFDVRQWFLVTSVQPLVIWMYKESYLRFSSQEYNLQNYHESVHLTNHAVQKKYRNGKRDERLPTENMWDCYTFQAYLRQIGEQEMWTERIYPGMQRAIIGTMLASQEAMDRRPNTFELFGADFMVSEDFYPWLIEINSSPDLGATTSVTARMCPQCLEDVIKVVIDRRADPKADTGNFEMIYRQLIPPTPAYMGLNLFLKGKQISAKNNLLRKERSAATFCHYKLSAPTMHRQRTFSSISPPLTANSSTGFSSFFNDKDNTESVGGPSLLDLFETFDVHDQNMVPRNSELRSVFKKFSLTPPSTISTFRTDSNLPSARLLTPITPNSRPQTQQSGSLLSPSKRGKVNEKLCKTSNEQAPKSAPVISRRHLSCGPKILATDDNGQPLEESDTNASNGTNQFECVGNKCSLENTNQQGDSCVSNNPAVVKQDGVACSRKHIYELLYKAKSAKIQRPSRISAKPKSGTPGLPATAATKRPHALSVKKLPNSENISPNKAVRAAIGRSPNTEYMASPFYAVGMSLRAWRSRYNKMLKGTNQLQTTFLPYRNVPPNTPLKNSPKRQLCKNLTKKMTEGRDRSQTAY